MSITRRLFLVLLLSLLLPFAARAQVAVGRGTGGGRVETVQLKSKLVGVTLPYNVVLPVDYEAAEARGARYPVLYLLHGLTGHYSDWTERSGVAAYAAQYHLIVVTPEGNNGWYTDSPTEPAEKYESYILQELIPDVDGRYRTIKAREGRAIAGLSMGGYGALKFGVKHPELFIFAGSLSGALKAGAWRQSELNDLTWALIKQTLQRAIGPEGSPTNDLFKLFREVPRERIGSLPYFYLDCGTEDLLFASNRELSGLLLERKIPHEYRQLPGKHEWPYWDAQVRDVLRLAAQKMQASK